MMIQRRIRHETTVDRFDGHLYVSSNGKLVVDEHSSDAEHLTASASRDSQPLYDCRTYLDEVVPKEWHGKRVDVEVMRIEVGGEVRAVHVKITPGSSPGGMTDVRHASLNAR